MSAVPKYLQKLPSTSRPYPHVEGFGRFYLESVGNTSYTTGINVYYHADGEDEARHSCIPFHFNLTDDFEMVWDYGKWPRRTTWWGHWVPEHERVRVSEPFQSNHFSAAEQRAAHALVQKHHERDETSFLFHMLGRIGMELHDLKYKRDNEERTIALFTDMTPTEHTSRDYIKQSLAQHQDALRSFDATFTERIKRLRALHQTCRAWSMDRDHHLVPDGLYNTLQAVCDGAEPPVIPEHRKYDWL